MQGFVFSCIYTFAKNLFFLGQPTFIILLMFQVFLMIYLH